ASPGLLPHAARGDRDSGPEAIPVALRSDEGDGEPVTPWRRVIAQQHGRAVVNRNQEVRFAVTVQIAGGEASPHDSGLQSRPCLSADFPEPPARGPGRSRGRWGCRLIMKQQRALLE